MRNRKGRGYRHRSNDRRHHHQPRINGVEKMRMGSNSFSQNRSRNSFISQQGAEKLVERYSALAKEALSSGDKIASENYLQHADHFMRIIVNKNSNQNQNQNGQQVEKDSNKVESTSDQNQTIQKNQNEEIKK